MNTQSDPGRGSSGKIIALPLGTTHPAELAETSKQFRLRTYSPPLPTRRELLIAALSAFALLAVGSSMLRLQLPDSSTNLMEARRGIADIATLALASSVLPSEKAESRSTLPIPDAQQRRTDSPEVQNPNAGPTKSAPTRINRETTAPARRARTNPFADRE